MYNFTVDEYSGLVVFSHQILIAVISKRESLKELLPIIPISISNIVLSKKNLFQLIIILSYLPILEIHKFLLFYHRISLSYF